MSLLSPRLTDKQKWLMPVMSSPCNGAHAVDGQLALYPWRNIFVRQGAEINGDGSKANPLNDLRLVFEDDTLECICRSLCCDYITVYVDGEIAAVSPDEEEDGSGSLELVAVDGQGRDYGGNLQIAPWGRRLKIKAAREFSLDDEEISEDSLLIGVRNVSGVVFRDVDIELTMKGTYVKKEEDDADGDDESRPLPELNVLGRLHCAEGLRRCSFPGSSLSATVKIDVSTEIGYYVYRIDEEDEGGGGLGPGWGSGDGGGAGGGGGGGGLGWKHYTPVIPPSHESGEDEGYFEEEDPSSVEWDSGKVNVRCVIRCFIRCDESDLSGSRVVISSEVKTSVGATVDAAGVAASKSLYCNSFTCDCDSRIIVKGGGSEYKVYNEEGELVESGIEDYSLCGNGLVSGIMGSPDGVFLGVLCDCLSDVQASALNTPYHRDEKTGAVNTGEIGGSSRSEAYGFRACRRAIIALADCICEAKATHPRRWLEMACPYISNVDAEITNSTGSDNYCRSSHVDVCDNLGACYSPEDT